MQKKSHQDNEVIHKVHETGPNLAKFVDQIKKWGWKKEHTRKERKKKKKGRNCFSYPN
jgi:hypothetical protein